MASRRPRSSFASELCDPRLSFALRASVCVSTDRVRYRRIATHVVSRLLGAEPLDLPVFVLEHLCRLLSVAARGVARVLVRLQVRLRALVLCAHREELELDFAELLERLGVSRVGLTLLLIADAVDVSVRERATRA